MEPSDNVQQKVEGIAELQRNTIQSANDITIAFADLVGSTDYKAGHSASEALLRTFLHNDIATRTFLEHDGRIVKYIGDAVMGAFEDPADAVFAAMEHMRNVAADTRQPGMQSRIGIHTGPVLFFKYSLTDSLDPQGTTVDLAARNVSAASPMQILLSKETAEKSASLGDIFSETTSYYPDGQNGQFQVCCVKSPGLSQVFRLPAPAIRLAAKDIELLQLAKAHLLAGQTGEPARIADAIFKREPRCIEAMAVLAQCAITPGDEFDTERAIELSRGVLAAEPEHYICRHVLSSALWERYGGTGNGAGQPDDLREAIENARIAMQIAEKRGDRYVEAAAANDLAYLLAETHGDLAEAEAVLRKAEAIHDQFTKVLHPLFVAAYGYVLLRGGRKGAEERLLEASRLMPRNSRVYEHLAEYYRNNP